MHERVSDLIASHSAASLRSPARHVYMQIDLHSSGQVLHPHVDATMTPAVVVIGFLDLGRHTG